MKKRELYRLELSETGVCVYFLARNVGRVAVVFRDFIRTDSRTGFGRSLPKYIIAEARSMIPT